MRKLIDNDYLTMLFRLTVGVIFIYASFYKIIEPADFAKSIWYYHLLPGSLINLMAVILPWLELLAGIFLIVGCQYRGAVLWVNLMMVMFIIALSYAVAKGISIDCGCFKASQAGSDSARSALYWDFLYLVMTLQLLFSRSKRWQLGKS